MLEIGEEEVKTKQKSKETVNIGKKESVYSERNSNSIITDINDSFCEVSSGSSYEQNIFSVDDSSYTLAVSKVEYNFLFYAIAILRVLQVITRFL